jgi:alkylation response protein AidB-like acyl-CoA dehydrogenase
MSIAITDEHRALAATAADFLGKKGAKAAARQLLESPDEGLPAFWTELCDLGWPGLHLPEAHGGSGFGLPELVIVTEEMGRAVTPGPFVPTVIASATIDAAGTDGQKASFLPGLAAGTTVAGVAVAGGGEVTIEAGSDGSGTVSGKAVVLGGGTADVIVVPIEGSDDVALVRAGGDTTDSVAVDVPTNLDPTRRAARVTFTKAAADVVPGGRRAFVDLGRVVLAAEATGVAREATEQAAEYAKVREQFGRPIAMYQAVKHHCANMLVATELATAAVWDAARAAGNDDPAQLTYTAAMAATLAAPAADWNAQLNMQVHGGIGFTWEHDCHVYLRRGTALKAFLDGGTAARHVTDLTRSGTRRKGSVDLPPEAEELRPAIREFAEGIKDLPADQQREKLIESGYVMPHWPKPWGRDADAIEQLVVEQEFGAAKIQRPGYGITGWVILTLIQHATEDQVARWVRPALNQELIWCQLFSEPDAGSDAAGIKTKGTRVEGGWLVTGQKVWTSGAHQAGQGFATVRTNPDAPKHNGITTMVIDMHADGVEVRPLKMPTGGSEFNEVFFNDVFVPDDDVVGPVDGGWTVARATLGNESVSIGGGQGGMSLPGDAFIAPFDAHPERLTGGAARIGRYIAIHQAMGGMNLRAAHRAVAGGGPGPEGNVTKLVLSENGHEAAAILAELSGPDTAFMDGAGAMTGMLVLMHRAMSIAGGTSEIKRNQIGERILGLPRDPLIK